MQWLINTRSTVFQVNIWSQSSIEYELFIILSMFIFTQGEYSQMSFENKKQPVNMNSIYWIPNNSLESEVTFTFVQSKRTFNY